MVNAPKSAVANGRLDSWKDIAAYVGKDVRTVIRWEEKGLPVHRVPGGKSVFAYRSEIDDWMHGKSNQATLAEGVAEDSSSGIVSSSTSGSIERSLRHNIKFFKHLGLAAFVVSLLLGILVAVFRFVGPGRSVQVTKVTRLTRDASFKTGLATDGANLYFGEYLDGRIQLSWMRVGGGPIDHIATPFSQALLQDVSEDGSELLVEGRDGKEEEAPLWIVPVNGGPLRRVGGVASHSAARSPDGTAIAYSRGNSIFVTLDEGISSRELRHFDFDPYGLHWSKSGDRLRFVLQNNATRDMKPWEMKLGDHFEVLAVYRIPFAPENCCVGSAETPDYQFFTTSSRYENQMWALPQRRHWWRQVRAQSLELPTPLGALSGLAADVRTGRLFAVAGEPSRGEFVRFEPFSRTFRPFLPGISGIYPDFSRDGKWIAFVGIDGGPLWISRADRKDTRQLTSTFEEVELPKWSPDGTEIAFIARNPGRPWRIYVVSREGGMPREVSTGDENQGAPTWSPDGKWLAYANVSCIGSRECAIHRIELATGKIESVPGSGGLRTARWSPDGRYIAALQEERHQLLVFDVAKQSWRKLSDSIDGDDLSWSYDSQYIYSNHPIGDKPQISRIPVRGGKPESVVDLESLSKLTGKFDNGLCVAPDGSVILLRQINSSDIYALDWSFR
jgi:hypothetical protein